MTMKHEVLTENATNWTSDTMWNWVQNTIQYLDNSKDMFTRTRQITNGSKTDPPIKVKFERNSVVHKNKWSLEAQQEDELAHIEFKPDEVTISVISNIDNVYLPRIIAVAAIIKTLQNNNHGYITDKRVAVSLGDSDEQNHALSFSSKHNNASLLPDPYFIISNSYSEEITEIHNLEIDWAKRKDVAYWRGAASGLGKYTNHLESQRIKLATLSLENRRSFDVKLTNIKDCDIPVSKFLTKMKLVTENEPQLNILKYKYQIDVDGWSNAWKGFFLKLASGSPVLKIESDIGYRQWYYYRLLPWINYVPVMADLSDLNKNLTILKKNPRLARSIGQMGRQLSIDLSYKSQLLEGSAVMLKFISQNTNTNLFKP